MAMIARRGVFGAGLALAAAGARAQAQEEWPARGLVIIVPFAPGSSSDIIARAISQPMQQALASR